MSILVIGAVIVSAVVARTGVIATGQDDEPIDPVALIDGAGSPESAEESSAIRAISTPRARFDGPYPWQPLPSDRAEARRETQRQRAELRAYDGAPPVMPHSRNFVKTKACLDCHADGFRLGDRFGSPVSHPHLVQCRQCHVERQNLEIEPRMHVVESLFVGLEALPAGTRFGVGSPPVMPHGTLMRTDCLACHGPASYPGLRTDHPERTNCVQCHAIAASLDQTSPFFSGGAAAPGTRGARKRRVTDGEGISRRRMLFGGFAGDPPAEGEPVRSRPEAKPGAAAIPVHRPPGAVDERAFLAGCTRCGDCIAACPVDAIVLAGERFGAAAGTPIIEPMKSPCVMCDDMPCIASCEPGVLSPEVPIRMGTASIRTPNCLAFMGTLCTVCSERCPVEGAITVREGRPIIDETRCTGCGVCQYVCPAPYNAVLILPADRDPAPPSEPTAGDGRDWRREYFEERSLRAPGGTEEGGRGSGFGGREED